MAQKPQWTLSTDLLGQKVIHSSSQSEELHSSSQRGKQPQVEEMIPDLTHVCGGLRGRRTYLVVFEEAAAPAFCVDDVLGFGVEDAAGLLAAAHKIYSMK